ncbi:tetratricopeptide repeat protein [Paraburkholderia rhizosphaerae]|uniref:Tetratricopeptide repeat protein n=1 Tax=Paraburkholderia rhizosphaerae TaxID=480658 RepID=A0A4R8L6Q6_9BURK|nr:tetratricopeptide repeat protein [Paraburkholderia rhizosphaerae]TDY37748.1 tetratricopeptide repeat protein [Paraburkholderia rhizosphaerae]
MKKSFTTILAAAFVSLALVSGSAIAAAVPSATQVETAIQQQNWQKAGSELQQVLQAHPDNARAHYLYGQVLDQQGRYNEALNQIQQAKTLDPQVRFTDPDRFAQTEARIRSDAARAGATQSNTTHNPFVQQSTGGDQQSAFASEAPQHHGPSMGMWIGIVIVIGAIALVLRWTLRRARSQSDTNADEERRVQLKRATELLNNVRSLKLDVKLSTAPGHEQLEKEVEGAEAQLRELVEGLSDRKNPVPPYQLDELERQVASLKARAEGRPDPNAAAAPNYSNESTFAREADANFGRQVPPGQQAPYPYPPQQQPPVVIQQGGGFGGGMGGLLTGVLLGEALNSGRDRVIERDVIVDDDERRRGGGDNSSVDFGQGSNDWDDGSGGGGDVDMGSDDSGGWNDT